MFMVCARMVDQHRVLVSNACRSTMLHYKSQLLRFLLTWVNLPFFIFGSREEKQTLLVDLYSDFEESPVSCNIFGKIQPFYVGQWDKVVKTRFGMIYKAVCSDMLAQYVITQ